MFKSNNFLCLISELWPYIILPEVAHVANDANPNKHGAGAEEDAAHVVARYDLQKGFKRGRRHEETSW